MPTETMRDFSRGITDNYIDAGPAYSEKANNLLINRLRKLFQRPGLVVFNDTVPQIPPGNQAVDGIYYFDATLFVKSGLKLYYLEDGAGAYVELKGPESNKAAFPDSVLGAKVSWSEWRGHLFITPGPGTSTVGGCRTIKVYRNSSNVWALYQAGLPRAEDGTSGGLLVESSGSDNVLTFEMFYRTYTAKVDGINVTFEDFGTPQFTKWTYDDIVNCANGTLTYADVAAGNYGPATMLVAMFRTKTNDVTPLFERNIALAASIAYNSTDAQLLQAAYFAGGVQFWDPVPLCYYSFIVEGYAYYLAAVEVETGQMQNTRIYQANGGNPNAVPGGNFVDVAVKLTGGSFVGIYPVVFGKRKAYRIEGRFDQFGNGVMIAKEISAVDGCISADAIIRLEGAILFPSENGWCWTDGFRVVNQSKHLTSTYSELVKTAMTGCYDAKNQRAYFGVESEALVPDYTGHNNAAFVMDLNFSDGSDGVFTTMSADGNLRPTAMHYDSANDRILIGDSRGYIFTFDADMRSDPFVDTAVSASTWGRRGVVWDWISAAVDFGDPTVSKLVTRMFVFAKNLVGKLSIDPKSHNDDKDVAQSLKVIRERKTTASGIHKVYRWMKKMGLYCFYKQVELKKGFVTIASSDDYALADLVTLDRSVMLQSGTFPLDDTEDVVGHSMAFSNDDYDDEYVISSVSGNTVILATAPDADLTDLAWVIRGYPKTEPFELHAVGIEYGGMPVKNMPGYQRGDDGGVSE